MTDIDCRDFRDLAPDLALALLAGDERGAALDHLATCASCRAHVEGLVHVADDLLMLAPAVEPGIGFESRLMARLAAEGAFSAFQQATPAPPTTAATSTGPGAPGTLPAQAAEPAQAAAIPTAAGPAPSPTPAATTAAGLSAAAPAPWAPPAAPVTPTPPAYPEAQLAPPSPAQLAPAAPAAPVAAVTPTSPASPEPELAPVTPLGRPARPARASRRPARLLVAGIAAVAATALAIGAAATGLRAGRNTGRASAWRAEASAVNELGARAVIVRADGGQSTCQLVAFPSDGSHPAWLAIHLDEPGEPPSNYLVYAEPADGSPTVLLGTIPVVGGQGSLTAVIPPGTGLVHGVRIVDLPRTVKYRATFAPI